MLQRTVSAGFIAPCLPTRTDKLPSGSEWLHEIKHDGFRLLARRDAAGVRLGSARPNRVRLMGRGHYGIFVKGASGRPKLMSSAIPNRQLGKGLGMGSGMTKEEPVPHFFLLAYDGTDADAPARRKSARGAHFEGIKPMVE